MDIGVTGPLFISPAFIAASAMASSECLYFYKQGKVYPSFFYDLWIALVVVCSKQKDSGSYFLALLLFFVLLLFLLGFFNHSSDGPGVIFHLFNQNDEGRRFWQ